MLESTLLDALVRIAQKFTARDQKWLFQWLGKKITVYRVNLHGKEIIRIDIVKNENPEI
jgi:hypothetical protein